MEKRIAFIFATICLILFHANLSQAQTQVSIDNGVLSFETEDTKAVSGIRWKTVGFTITMRKCLGKDGNGGYPAKYQHVKINLADGAVKTYDIGNGKVKNVFCIPEKILTGALINAGFSEVLNDGGTIYLNGIFAIVKNGKECGEYYDSLNGIKYAQPWRNPNDFNDRFDIAVKYNAATQKITVKYLDNNNKVLKTQQLNKKYWKKPGEYFDFTLMTTMTISGKKYYLDESYFVYNSSNKEKQLFRSIGYGYKTNEIKKIKSRMRLGGVTIYAVMKPKKEDKDGDDSTEIILNNEKSISNSGIIKSEQYMNEKFDVEKAIPSGEKVYFKSNVDPYIYDVKLKKISGQKKYNIVIKKQYVLEWKERYTKSDGSVGYINKTKNVDLNRKVSIGRDYCYWKIDNVNVFYLKEIMLCNNSFGKNTVSNTEKIKKCIFNICETHIKEPKYNKEIILPKEIIDGGFEQPTYPTMDFNSVAENRIGDIKVRNDRLVIGGITVLSDKWQNITTTKPKIISKSDFKKIELLKRNIPIPVSTLNGQYDSNCEAVYQRCMTNNSVDKTNDTGNINIKINVNSLTVHTPVVCDGQISNQLSKCQLVNIDMTKAQLILNTEFYVKLSNTGNHISQKGYYYQNFGRYVKENYVKFPFDVYVNNRFYKENTWIQITGEDKVKCFVPPWIKEGEYCVEFKSNAYNVPMNKKYDNGNVYNKLKSQYSASDKVHVVVSGRMFNFSIYDISDYPLWKKVFRDDKGQLNGVNYAVGINNCDGIKTTRKELYTLPLLNGSHPFFNNKGMLKCGYKIKFFIDTLGEMSGENDCVYIKPHFYFVDKKGKRIEVDVFYSESFSDKNGKKYSDRLIKIGSKLDSLNKKVYNYGKGESVYTFSNVNVNKNARCFIGNSFLKQCNISNMNIGKNQNTTNTCESVNECAQRWFFEYYLPANLHLAEKGTVNEKESIDFEDECWLKDGYLMLNFDIYSVNDKNVYLDYKNDFNNKIYGACNMWIQEGYNKKKTDYQGNQFNIGYGDIALFYIKKTVANDYVSGGTH